MKGLRYVVRIVDSFGVPLRLLLLGLCSEHDLFALSTNPVPYVLLHLYFLVLRSERCPLCIVKNNYVLIRQHPSRTTLVKKMALTCGYVSSPVRCQIAL